MGLLHISSSHTNRSVELAQPRTNKTQVSKGSTMPKRKILNGQTNSNQSWVKKAWATFYRSTWSSLMSEKCLLTITLKHPQLLELNWKFLVIMYCEFYLFLFFKTWFFVIILSGPWEPLRLRAECLLEFLQHKWFSNRLWIVISSASLTSLQSTQSMHRVFKKPSIIFVGFSKIWSSHSKRVLIEKYEKGEVEGVEPRVWHERVETHLGVVKQH